MVITYNLRTGETHSTEMTPADRKHAVAMLTRMFEVRQAKQQPNGAAPQPPNGEQ